MNLRTSVAKFVGAFIGTGWARYNHGLNLKRASRSFMNINYINKKSSAFLNQLAHDEAEPVFILSAGWRSGSTLLQRMICASGNDTIIWGEPYAYCDLVPSMAAQFLPFSEDWPNDIWFRSSMQPDLANDWIANLYPNLSDFHAAHRAFFERMLCTPAKEAGYKNWGFKEVRLTAHDAAYLRWLFPRCKLLFLARNPYHAYASYKDIGTRNYVRFPHQPVFTAWQFGTIWARAVDGFRASADHLDALFLRYEDLSLPDTAAKIAAYLGRPVPPASQMSNVGKSQRIPLEWTERMLMRMAAGQSAKSLGYDKSGPSRESQSPAIKPLKLKES